jgi:serine/threonine protein phosphatase PrpC
MPGWPAMGRAADPLPGPRLALVVATNTYTDPGLRQLRAPARDADDLTHVLADPGIGGFAVSTVIDQPSHQIRLAIEDFLDGRGTGDLLLVYLSCHGLLDARRRLYFAATDTRKDRLGSTGVESAWVLDQLEHCRARRQVLILDSCFSGAFAHGAKGEADLGLQDRFQSQGRGRVVLTASTATEYSFEGDPTDAAIPAGSVFTAALVQGLRTGAADTDHDGHVSVDDAYAYVFDQVQAAGAAQTPQRWLYGAEGQILLARSPAGPTIIPASLPDWLRAGLDNPNPNIRIGAVTELGEWLTGGDPARMATARRHLQEVADTDVSRVAGAARNFLDTRTDKTAHVRGRDQHDSMHMASLTCPDCGVQVQPEDLICFRCGANLPAISQRSITPGTKTSRLTLRYAVRSDVGLIRNGNKDSAYAGPRLLAVADGMGGHAAGEVASSLTIASMAKLDSEPRGGDMLSELAAAVAAANARLQEMIIANPAVEGMSTSLTALYWSDGHAAVCHIGHSRGYLLRDGEIYQITHDHTLVQSLVDEGRISADDVSTHPQRGEMLRVLDGRSVAEPDLSVHDGQAGDRYLLCSDGLSGVVSVETLRETMATIEDPDSVTRQLIELALRGGGPDNITCIVADVVDTATSRVSPTETPILAGAAANVNAPRLSTRDGG